MVDIKWFEPQAWVIWQAIESEQNMQPDKENMNWGLIHADFDTEQWWYTKNIMRWRNLVNSFRKARNF